MKADEELLLLAVVGSRGTPVRDVASGLRIHPKRLAYILDKWCRKGWYDYGVSLDLGWLTDEGKSAAKEVSGGKFSDAAGR